jgi:hypothetical protein
MNEDKPGVVVLHGNEYETVALRVTKFREDNPDWTIKTKIIGAGEYVSIKASILDAEGKLIATGHAEEERGIGINKTSAIENCETSAVGRALGFYKYPGQFLRSADEMSDALVQQGVKAVEKDFGERMLVIRGMLDQIVDFKDRLADGDLAAAAEIESEWSEEQHEAIKLAPTKGGILTTEEVNKLKSNEYFEARNIVVGFVPKEKSNA